MFLPQAVPGPVVSLRPWRDADADQVAAACDDPLTQRFLPLLPSPYTRDHALWWIREGSVNAFAQGGAAFCVTDQSGEAVLGGAGVGRVRVDNQDGEMGYWVAPWARSRGVATAAARTLSAHAFDRGLVRLELKAEPANAPSQRVALAAGFTREGVQRGGGRSRGGGRHDLIVWARLAGDPAGPTRRLLPDLPPSPAADGARVLTDGTVTLMPVRPADADDTYALRNLPDVIATSVPPTSPSPAGVRHSCATAESGWLAGDRADLTIRDTATGTYAGEIGLYFSEPVTGQAMLGYSVVPAWRGRGYATRAVRLLAGWAFGHVGLARLVAGAHPDNAASRRVLETAGFRAEGYQRSRLPGPGGRRVDDVLYALLREDYRR